MDFKVIWVYIWILNYTTLDPSQVLAKSSRNIFGWKWKFIIESIINKIKISWNSTVESWISYKIQWDLWRVTKINWIVK